MRTNYVFIDYENVQPAALAVLKGEHFKVIVFVGASQSKVTFDVASSLQRLGPDASYVKISGNGPNALDFHIAYYIGQYAAAEPDAFFHIISEDTGFDPLIAHLKTRKILARRSCNIADMPIIKAAEIIKSAKLKGPSETLAVVTARLKRLGASKPRTIKTLASTISSLFQKELTKSELESLLKLMKKHGLITVSDNKVSYSFPE